MNIYIDGELLALSNNSLWLNVIPSALIYLALILLFIALIVRIFAYGLKNGESWWKTSI